MQAACSKIHSRRTHTPNPLKNYRACGMRKIVDQHAIATVLGCGQYTIYFDYFRLLILCRLIFSLLPSDLHQLCLLQFGVVYLNIDHIQHEPVLWPFNWKYGRHLKGYPDHSTLEKHPVLISNFPYTSFCAVEPVIQRNQGIDELSGISG